MKKMFWIGDNCRVVVLLVGALLWLQPYTTLSQISQEPEVADSLMKTETRITAKGEEGQLKNEWFRSVKPVAAVAAFAGLGTLTYVYIDEPLQQFSQRNQHLLTDRVAGVVEPLGRNKYVGALSGAALVGGLVLKDKQLQKAATIALSSMLTNAVVTDAIKTALKRHRPASSPENHLFDGPVVKSHHSSLPSSHTSAAFAMATSFATVYSHKKYVPSLAYGAASLVGLSRIYDNAHWASDVLAGAAVGFLSSKAVSYLYGLAEKKISDRKQRLFVIPMLNLESASVLVTLSL